MPLRFTRLPSGEIKFAETGEGTKFADHITGIDATGTRHAEVIRGHGDSDQLFGGLGSDRISGGKSSDHIYGGRGGDFLKGGAGNDLFYYEYPRDGRDTIKDFVPGEDLIILVASGGAGFLSGPAALSFDDATNKLTYDYDGPGGIKPVLIAKLNTDISIDGDIVFI